MREPTRAELLWEFEPGEYVGWSLCVVPHTVFESFVSYLDEIGVVDHEERDTRIDRFLKKRGVDGDWLRHWLDTQKTAARRDS